MLSGLQACTRLSSWHHTLSNTFLTLRNPTSLFHTSSPLFLTLNQAIRRKVPQVKKRPTAPLLQRNPFKKGVVNQIFIAKPKKPNSAKRKVAKVTLSNGETVQAYIQGEGHNLQEHSVVLVRGGRAQDLPGVRCVFCFVVSISDQRRTIIRRYKLVRGALDFGGVVNRATARSRYGGSSSYSFAPRLVVDTSNSQEAKIIDRFLILTILHTRTLLSSIVTVGNQP